MSESNFFPTFWYSTLIILHDARTQNTTVWATSAEKKYTCKLFPCLIQEWNLLISCSAELITTIEHLYGNVLFLLVAFTTGVSYTRTTWQQYVILDSLAEWELGQNSPLFRRNGCQHYALWYLFSRSMAHVLLTDTHLVKKFLTELTNVIWKPSKKHVAFSLYYFRINFSHFSCFYFRDIYHHKHYKKTTCMFSRHKHTYVF